MKRRDFVLRLGGAALAWSMSTRAQQRNARPPRVAIVQSSTELTEADPTNGWDRSFIDILADIGLVDGRDVILLRRSAEGRPNRFPFLMREVISLDIDLIVTVGAPGVRAAQAATNKIPIVAVVDYAYDAGVIESFARPGRNLTGIGTSEAGVESKRLQILKEAAPWIKQVAVIAYGPRSAEVRWQDDFNAAARAMGINLLWIGVDASAELVAAFATIIHQHADALYVKDTDVNYAERRRIGEFALKHRLPTYGGSDDGFLFEYAASLGDIFPRLAIYVKKILDGVRPGDLPFEQPSKFELVFNLRTAKAIGVSIAPSLLLRADRLIE